MYINSGSEFASAAQATMQTFLPDPSLYWLSNIVAGACILTSAIWMQVREPSFGMGVLEFVDSTTAIWQWYRNSETPVKDTADEVVLVRDPTCQPPQRNEAIDL